MRDLLLTIKLEDSNPTDIKPYFTGDRMRLATANGVCFINEDTLIVGSVAGMSLYVFQVDYATKSYKLLQSLETKHKGKYCYAENFDFKNSKLVVSNATINSCNMYTVENNLIRLEKNIPCIYPGFWNTYIRKYHFVHGVRIVTNSIIAYTAFGVGVVFIDHKKNKFLLKINHHNGMQPKDVFIINKNSLLILSANSKLRQGSSEVKPISRLSYYRFNLETQTTEEIDYLIIPDSHTDVIGYFEGDIYINNLFQDTVMKFSIENEKLVSRSVLGGFSFPHGIGISPSGKKLAVTNYGSNSIDILIPFS